MTAADDRLQRQSQEIRQAYARLADEVSEAEATARTLSAEEAKFASSQYVMMWRRFRRNRAAIIGGLIVLLYYLAALFGQFVAPYTLTTRFTQYLYLPPQPVYLFDEGSFRPHVCGINAEFDASLRRTYTPNCEEKYPIQFFSRGVPYSVFGLFESDLHLFTAGDGVVSLLGTDRQGRDMFTRIVYGAQISLTVGLAGVAMSLFIGTVLGVASGYYGGWIDEVIQRVIELVRAFPSIPLWMALSAALPTNWPPLQTYFAVTLILSLIGWTWLARQLRGQVLALRQTDYVMAAKLVGASDWRIIFRHLIPASISQIIVVTTLALPTMILAETSLSFLGLGLRAPLTSWGVLLQESQNVQSLALYPWVFYPALFMIVIILAFSFLGDGLRDASDPYTV
ncbi:MAG TPA: ABC transporter permease [Spirillospora sp.]|nr:ABC transporter permease [Spirillospora sp.]